MGCATNEDGDFHVFDGAQFNGKMSIGHMAEGSRSEYTYEGWVRSPLEGKQRREIFGGSSKGFTLTNENAVPCLHDVGTGYMKGGNKESGYQLHVGGTEMYGAFCLEEDTWYHVAATKNNKGQVHIYVNGRDVTEKGHNIANMGESTLEKTVGGGFVDGGQLFNLRIWSYARTPVELYSDAFATRFEDMQTDVNGLDHWWPLTQDLKDVMTGQSLSGPAIRYKPVWWSDLERSGMRGGWKAGYGLPFAASACGGAGVDYAECLDKDAQLGCVYVPEDRVEQCNYIGGNHIDAWGCYSDVSDRCEPPTPEIKFWAGHMASRPAADQFEALVDASVANELICHTDLETVEYSNQATCGGGNRNVAFKIEATFKVDVPGEWHFDFNVDFGWGGVVLFDGIRSHEGYHSGDHWWANNLNRALPLDIAHNFEVAGMVHTMTVYGAEGCCDGFSKIRFKRPGGEYQQMSMTALKETKVVIDEPVVVQR